MTRITIDSSMWKKLLAIREVVALCDETGRVVGHFHPGPPRDAQGNAIIPFSDDELKARSQEQGGRPLKDILDDLSKL